MFNLQGSEIIVILLIALVVLGPERLPDAIRRFMQTYNELRKMGSGFQSEIKSAFDEPMREMRDTAKLVRDSVDPSAFIAEAEAEQRLRDEAAAARAADTAADADTPTHTAVETVGANGSAPSSFPAPGDAPVDAPAPGTPPAAGTTPAPPPPPPPPPPPGAPVRHLREVTSDETRAAS